MHLPSFTGLCVLFALAGILSGWQVKQSLPTLSARSFPWEEVCGLWHTVQSPPVVSAEWTYLLFSLSAMSVWHDRHIFILASGFSKNLLSSAWAVTAQARPRTMNVMRKRTLKNLNLIPSPFISSPLYGTGRTPEPRTAGACFP